MDARQALGPASHRRRDGLHCDTCAARCGSVWGAVEGAALDHLDRNKIVQRVEPGHVLYHQGTTCHGLYVVQSGTVAVRKFDESGRSVLLRLVLPGDAIGYRCFFNGGRYQAQAETLEASRVCYLEGDLVQQMLSSNPGVMRGMLQRMAADLGAAEERFLMATRRSMRARLAHALLELRDRHGVVDDEGVLTLTLPISRQDLADLLGTRPETIARTTSALQKDGVAMFHGRRVVIQDLDLLLDELDEPV